MKNAPDLLTKKMQFPMYDIIKIDFITIFYAIENIKEKRFDWIFSVYIPYRGLQKIKCLVESFCMI